MLQNWESLFSENMKGYGGYSIGKILKYLQNPEIISLAGGLPSSDMFLKSQIRAHSKKMLENNLESIFQYSGVPGEASLRTAIIDFLKQDNILINEKNLLITSSGQHGLDLCGRLFLNEGDPVLLDRPTFAGAIVAFQMQRPEFVGVNLEENGSDIKGFKVKIEELKKTGKKTKFIYVVPDFQNPTGITMALDKRKILLDLSYEFNIPIVEDSPYRAFRYHGKTIPSIFSLDQKRDGDHVIGLYTFSKLFCPGIRVGFNIGCEEIIEKMTNIKEGNLLNTPKYNQDLCTAFLTDMRIDEHIEKCKTYYGEKLDFFLQTMNSYFPPKMGVSWTKPEGGLFLWVTLPNHFDTTELFYEAIKFKVAFVPGEVFYGADPEKNHMRINFSYASKEQLAEAIKRLADCIRHQL